MKKSDVAALGLMTFSLFFGASNVIFPPMIGFMAGDQTFAAGLGFICGDVGMTLLALLAIALQGGPEKLLQDFHPALQKTFWLTLFSIIGPACVIPRATLVVYETGITPFTGDSPPAFYGFIALFLCLCTAAALNPKTMVTAVGKWMTPTLLLLLIVISIAALFAPAGTLQAPEGGYLSNAFGEGLVQGYLTMDLLGALGVGWVLSAAIQRLGFTSSRDITRYTLILSVCAATGLIIVYTVLMHLGAISHALVSNASNGGQILAAYVIHVFGSLALAVLTAVLFLACLTTCVGATGAGAQYVHNTFPKVSYRLTVIITFIGAGLVALAGLDKLMVITIPIVVAFYPVAITLVFTALIRPWLLNPKLANYTLCLTSLIFSTLDALVTTGIAPLPLNSWLNHHIPLFDSGIGWLIPTIIVLLLHLLWRPHKSSTPKALRS